MDAATVHRLLSLIPERSTRAQSGTLFSAEETARARDAERFAYLTPFLQWLTPLNPITREDQRALGLLAAQARPGHVLDEAEDVEDAVDELDPVLEDDAPLGMDLATTLESQPVTNTQEVT